MYKILIVRNSSNVIEPSRALLRFSTPAYDAQDRQHIFIINTHFDIQVICLHLTQTMQRLGPLSSRQFISSVPLRFKQPLQQRAFSLFRPNGGLRNAQIPFKFRTYMQNVNPLVQQSQPITWQRMALTAVSPTLPYWVSTLTFKTSGGCRWCGGCY